MDFFSLKLPAETRAYVPKLLAMRRLVANPEDYGIAFSPIPNEPYFVKVDTGGQLDLSLAAELAGITLDEVYELNPGFHRWATDPAGPHFLLLPRDTADAFTPQPRTAEPRRTRARLAAHREEGRVGRVDRQEVQDAAHRHPRHEQPRQRRRWWSAAELRVPTAVVNLPAKVMLAAARVDGRSGRTGRRPRVHVVRSGDSLWRIAKRHRMDVATLARLNGMGPGDTLRAGQKLVLNTRAALRRQIGVVGRLARGQLQGAQRRHAVAHRPGVRRDGLRPRQLERHQQALHAASRARSSPSTSAAADFPSGAGEAGRMPASTQLT